MHEMTIVHSIIEMAEKVMKEHDGRSIEAINIDIGKLVAVEPVALDLAWDYAIPNTVLDKAERRIAEIPGEAKCSHCDTVFALDTYYAPCPACGEFDYHIMNGEQLLIRSLVLH